MKLLRLPPVTCQENNTMPFKITYFLICATSCAAHKTATLLTLPTAQMIHRNTSSEKASAKVELTGVEVTQSNARNKPKEKKRGGDCPGIHRVIKESKPALRWSLTDRCAERRAEGPTGRLTLCAAVALWSPLKVPELQGRSYSYNYTDTTKTGTDSREQGSYFQPMWQEIGAIDSTCSAVEAAERKEKEEEEGREGTVSGGAWGWRVLQQTAG